MANLKNITDVPVVESVEGLNLIVNDNGTAKQVPASAVGAQADWAETDESSASFIKNKPQVTGGFDLIIEREYDTFTATIVKGSYEDFYNKIISGVPPIVLCYATQIPSDGERNYDFYNVYSIVFEGGLEDRHISIKTSEYNDKGFVLYRDNSVKYWEYND